MPIHRHPNSNETFVCLCGKMVSVIYEEDSVAADFPMGMDAQDIPSGKRLKESGRYMLDPTVGNFGYVVPKGAWHTIEIQNLRWCSKPKKVSMGRMELRSSEHLVFHERGMLRRKY